MNAEFFALAFTAALNPKLLAIDLLLIENRRPRAMFLYVLPGGMTGALTIGLDVLTVHADAISSQGKASAGVDLGMGMLLPAAGGLLATGRLHGRQRASPSRHRAAGEAGEEEQLGSPGAAEPERLRPVAVVTRLLAGQETSCQRRPARPRRHSHD